MRYRKKPVIIDAFQYDGDLMGSDGERMGSDKNAGRKANQ